jgi:hypothetical protein
MDTRMHVIETQHWKLVCVTNLSIDSIVDVGVCLMCFQTYLYAFEHI